MSKDCVLQRTNVTLTALLGKGLWWGPYSFATVQPEPCAVIKTCFLLANYMWLCVMH